MSEFGHVILTRFNVREQPEELSRVANQAWLERRFELFDQFCYPSVRTQTSQDFRWVVFFDEATPDAFRERIDRYRVWGNFTPVYTAGLDRECVGPIVFDALGCTPPYVITTRLDNDDALSRDFVQLVHQQFQEQEREVINFTNGYVWHKGRIYLHRDGRNAFASMIEESDQFLGVWSRPHERLSTVAPVRQLLTKPTWLQVVHGTNVRNRVRGMRDPIANLTQRFSIKMEMKNTRENPAEFWIDRWLITPFRLGREAVIRIGKIARGC